METSDHNGAAIVLERDALLGIRHSAIGIQRAHPPFTPDGVNPERRRISADGVIGRVAALH